MIIGITGVYGTLGTALTEFFLNQGHSVVGLDDFSTGVKKQFYNSNFTFFNHHLNDRFGEHYVSARFEQVDVIIHLAATVGVKNVMQDPTKTMDNNIGATKCILSVANQLNKHIFIASTSEIYGKNISTLTETSDVIYGPSTKSRWSYAVSKLIDEHLSLDLFRKKNIPITIFRFSNVSGPNQTSKYGMVLPRFVEQAINNKSITVFNDGSQKRCFTHIKDVCTIFSICLEHLELIKGEIYNIGNTTSTSIKNVACYIKEKTNSSSEITYNCQGQFYNLEEFDDMQERNINSTKILKFIDQYKKDFYFTDWKNIVNDIIEYKLKNIYGKNTN